MSVAVWAKVWRVPLPAVEKIVLLRLADAANEDGTQAFPSVPRMARECGLGERTVQDALKRLRTKGLIVETAPSHGKKATTYKVDLGAIAKATEGCGSRTGAGAAPVQELRPTPAAAAPLPVQQLHPEPSFYPSFKRPRGRTLGDVALTLGRKGR
jgi:biotin operon repressor